MESLGAISSTKSRKILVIPKYEIFAEILRESGDIIRVASN